MCVYSKNIYGLSFLCLSTFGICVWRVKILVGNNFCVCLIFAAVKVIASAIMCMLHFTAVLYILFGSLIPSNASYSRVYLSFKNV